MSNYRLIKPVLIAVIWITILVRGTLVMAMDTRDFFNVAIIDKACDFLVAPTEGVLVESYRGAESLTSLVSGEFYDEILSANLLKGTPSRARINCLNTTGTYAIITSPQFVPTLSTSNISADITTSISTLYRGETSADVNFSAADPITPILSVVGNGIAESRSTPILLIDGNGNRVFSNPTWFLMGMEIMIKRQGVPSGGFTFKSSLTLLPN